MSLKKLIDAAPTLGLGTTCQPAPVSRIVRVWSVEGPVRLPAAHRASALGVETPNRSAPPVASTGTASRTQLLPLYRSTRPSLSVAVLARPTATTFVFEIADTSARSPPSGRNAPLTVFHEEP